MHASVASHGTRHHILRAAVPIPQSPAGSLGRRASTRRLARSHVREVGGARPATWASTVCASSQLDLSELTALGPLDGRYASKTASLRPFFSEYVVGDSRRPIVLSRLIKCLVSFVSFLSLAKCSLSLEMPLFTCNHVRYGLIRYRIAVECRWLQHLSTIPGVIEVPGFSSEANKILEELALGFSVEDAAKVKEVERVTNHDVKAVEYVLKDKIKGCEELERVLEFVHFACTSEDINNLSHGMMLKEGVKEVLTEMDRVIEEISRYVNDSPRAGRRLRASDRGRDMAARCVGR